MIGAMRRLSATILLLSSTSNMVFAQTLEQSVSFILSGGSIELSDIKQIDADTVSASIFGGWQKLKIIDRNHCILRAFDSTLDNNHGYLQYNFNNIVLNETKFTTQCCILDHEIPVIEFHGEEDVLCNSMTGCFKSFHIMLNRSNVERVTNAIKYVFSNFCSSAKRKSAF
jgi:hypothetical protein